MTIFREEVTSALSGFSCGSSILVELEFGDIGFHGGRKTGEPEEKLLEQSKSQHMAHSWN